MSQDRTAQVRTIAHELNNWLAAIATQASLVQDDNPDPALQVGIQRIANGAEASIRLVKQLTSLYPAVPRATTKE